MNPINNSKTPKSNLLQIIGIVLVLGSVGYYFYSASGSSTSTSGSSFTISSPTSGGVGDGVLTLLNQIQSLKIDTTLFQSPVYQSLVDFTRQIPPEPIGKANPFVPGPGLVNPTLVFATSTNSNSTSTKSR